MRIGYSRLLTAVVVATGLAPVLVWIASQYLFQYWATHQLHPIYDPWPFVCAAAVLVAAWLLQPALRALDRCIEEDSVRQYEYIEALPLRHVDIGIVAAAAISLFVELAIIRWQASVFPFFSFYKNVSLLACFAGLAMGYATANSKRICLALSLPLFCWQFLMMLGVRYGMGDWARSLQVMPFREQLQVGIFRAGKWYYASQTYFFLAVVFFLTALAFIPIGQLCGALMDRREKLRAYGLNLLGSFLGVVAVLVSSALWTPPVIWFALPFAALLPFIPRQRRTFSLTSCFVVLAIVILAWPVGAMWNRVYSPYQMLEIGQDDRGLMIVRAAGFYYQRVQRFHGQVGAVEESTRKFYELPYVTRGGRPGQVAVVGAGTGNDVTAALVQGADHVDAIEIDPAILLAGRGHPDHPYRDPRVQQITDDARSFLRRTSKKYDMIVYGLLDSHTLLSQASSVRLDSFVYTVEGLKEARAKLKPDGMVVLSFGVMTDEVGRKLYLMLSQAFDGRPPVCVRGRFEGATAFFAPNSATPVHLPTAYLEEAGLQDVTSIYANPAIHADVSTDDWPFFYMPRRVYPISYLPMAILVVVVSLAVAASFSHVTAPQLGEVPFFFLGAGFMLIETKAITELGLTFGNSWQVIGIVIAAIMAMAFLANCAVQWLGLRNPVGAYGMLVAAILLGLAVAHSGGLPSTPLGKLATVALLCSPMLFSGIVFSILLQRQGELSGSMAWNLFGAICGGLLEYNSMYFGFQFLYVLAAGLYIAAFCASFVSKREVAVQTARAESELSFSSSQNAD
jgi:spermidine synthase